MSSITEIETAIQRLSIAEQRTVALHLKDRLGEKAFSEACDATDEGIRFLDPHCFGFAPREVHAPRSRQRARAAC